MGSCLLTPLLYGTHSCTQYVAGTEVERGTAELQLARWVTLHRATDGGAQSVAQTQFG